MFDIDKTLLKSARGHHLSFSESFKKVYGIDTDIDIIEHDGMTDQQIIMEVLKKNGVAEKTDENDEEIITLKAITRFFYGSENIQEKHYEIVKRIVDKGIDIGEDDSAIQKAMMLHGLETHAPIVHALDSPYWGFALKLVDQLVKEYDCKTASEKATAQMAAVSHAKALQYEKKLRDCLGIEWHSNEKNGYFAMISKEVDRSTRQYMSAITILRQMKAPTINISVKDNTAFVAKNQQVNVNRPQNNDENIEPK